MALVGPPTAPMNGFGAFLQNPAAIWILTLISLGTNYRYVGSAIARLLEFNTLR